MERSETEKVKKFKVRKTPAINGIIAEILMYGGESVEFIWIRCAI